MGYDAVSVKQCYFVPSVNHAPVHGLEGCEVHSSTGQGYYYYRIVFNVKREYIAEGVWEGGSLGKTPASSKLNEISSNHSEQFGYDCWTTNEPYLKVCIQL